MRKDTERTNRHLSDLSPEDPKASHKTDDRFDGVGQLTRVVSPKADAPRYALVDDLGQVRHYVSPAPGVRLRDYLGRKVGVNGTRGYMPEQRAHHITAKRVNLVGSNRLR